MTENNKSGMDFERSRLKPLYTGDPVTDAMSDFLDARADKWMQETHIVSVTHSMAAIFQKYAPRETLEKFRSMLEAHLHMSFVEGAFRAWEEISAQQKALGNPLPPMTKENWPVDTGDTA